MRNFKALTLFCFILGCGTQGPDGADGNACSVSDNGDGTATLTCSDGTEEVLSSGTRGEDGAAGETGADGPDGLPGPDGEDGANGKDGRDCSVTQNDDGTATITCSDGTSTTIGVDVDSSQDTTGGNGGGCFGAASDLIISEYIEGSSYNKAIEIFNGTSNTVTLNGYTLQRGTNGGALTTMLQLSGSLEPGEVHVVCNGGANAEIIAQCDQSSGALTFNGNDAVALNRGSVTLDVVGQPGQDPGSAGWSVSTGSTTDYTLVRKSNITSGSTNWSEGASQWDVYEENNVYYLGTHGFDCDE